MTKAYTNNGKEYMRLSDKEFEDIKAKKDGTPIYCMDEGYGIVPPDCKHDFEISRGFPRNIKGCKKCIYWEFTMEEPEE